MSENNLMTARVTLEIDPKKAIEQSEKAAKKLQDKLAKDNARTASQLSKQIDSNVRKSINGAFQMAERIKPLFERAFQFSTATGASSIYSFIKSGSAESVKFTSSVNRLKVAWARVGETLATKVKFADRTILEWVNVFADRIENLDTSQIEKLVGYVKAIGAGMIALRGIGYLKPAIETIGTLSNVVSGTSKLNKIKNIFDIGSSIAGTTSIGASAIGTTSIGASAIGAGAIGAGAIGAGAIGAGKLKTITNYNNTGRNAIQFPSDSLKKGWSVIDIESIKGKNIQESSNVSKIGNYFNVLKKLTPILSESLAMGSGIAETFRTTKLISKGEYSNAIRNQFGGGNLGFIGASIYYGNKFRNRFDSNDISWNSKSNIAGAGGFLFGQLIGGLGLGKSKFIEELTDKLINYFSPPLTPINWEDVVKKTIIDKRQDVLSSTQIGASEQLRKSDVYKRYLEEQSNMFPSGSIPAFKLTTTGMVRHVSDKIKEFTKTEAEMMDIWDGMSLTEKTFNSEFKSVLDQVTAEKNAYITEQQKQISIYREQVNREKEYNKNIGEFNKRFADNLMSYDMYAQKALDVAPTALQTSVSTGGGIGGIPSIVANAINEMDNTERQKQLELMQKSIDLEEQYGKMMERQWELDVERKKFEEEWRKQDAESRKTTNDWLKEIGNAVTGGSSTTINT